MYDTPPHRSSSKGKIANQPVSPSIGQASPSVKRALNFDFWKDIPGKSDESIPSKRQKLDETHITINDLEPGKYTNQQLNFRVSLKTVHESENGELLKFHCIDDTGEVSVIAFPGDAQKIINVIEVNKCYQLKNFEVRQESGKYPSGTGSNVEVKFKSGSTLEEIILEMPAIPFNFKTEGDVELAQDDEKMDLLALVVKNWGLQDYGPGKLKRDLNLLDDAGQTSFTLWNAAAKSFGDDNYIPIAIRKAVRQTYKGSPCLNARTFTLIWKKPAVEGVDALVRNCCHQMEKKGIDAGIIAVIREKAESCSADDSQESDEDLLDP